MDETSAQAKMLVEGKKRAGDFYVHATKYHSQRDWKIEALEIKYKGSINKYRFYKA